MGAYQFKLLAGVVVVFTATLMFVGCGGRTADNATSTADSDPAANESAPSEAAEPMDEAKCEAPSDWFTSPPQAPDFAKFPADPTNCDFHLWAWQEFLYLTTRDGTGGRPFESLAMPSNLFVKSGAPGDYPGTTEAAVKRTLQPRALKPNQTEEAITQAGGGVLFDQKGQVVYYEARIDKNYYDFIKNNKYYDPSNIANAPADTQFPVGTLEIKISWRVASTETETFIDDADKRFITNDVLIAPVTGYNEEKKTFVVDTENPIPATVALVGMHLVGLVQGHPEFVWSTFEHVDNAPDIANTPTSDPGPTGPWSFYTRGTDCKTGGCNLHPTTVPANPPYPPTDVCLVQPQGGGDATNIANIISLNKSVHGQLQDPVLSNYKLGGGLWTNNGALPPEKSNLKGSIKLANTTLETFFQGPPPEGAVLLNCFDCHNEGPPPGASWTNTLEINFSHLLGLTADYKK